MAVSATAYLKRHGNKVKLLIRGGREPHGAEVIDHARHQGLAVLDAKAPKDVAELASLLRQQPDADVVNFTSFVSDEMLAVIYPSCDAVLANSGHEPFGLVGLEVMAAGGLAVTGSTGEDYAHAFRNALVMETDDPIELVTELNLLKQRPQLAAAIRRRGRVTARLYTWEKVIDQLLLRVEFAGAQQAVRVPATAPEAPKAPKRPPRKTIAARG
jgi:glycosyltransferase involved in cell wall biosynthesis